MARKNQIDAGGVDERLEAEAEALPGEAVGLVRVGDVPVELNWGNCRGAKEGVRGGVFRFSRGLFFLLSSSLPLFSERDSKKKATTTTNSHRPVRRERDPRSPAPVDVAALPSFSSPQVQMGLEPRPLPRPRF